MKNSLGWGNRGGAPARVTLVALALLIGLFTAFVGWNKAFAPLAVLAQHSAWTHRLPEFLGRLLGWSEMLAVALLWLGLVARPMVRWGAAAALWITLNHSAGALVHGLYAEWHALPQSAVLVPLCMVLFALYRRRSVTIQQREII